ncbi:hypothetical protein [uncultured Photobacterium sp.]|uniref:hypothetical protein n=1 Tax=uncultured Photobacterium sp. TaxID=173973 RepID=UPI00263731F9|nr:hypothetical protein [uncultured Photobacterium sp.]
MKKMNSAYRLQIIKEVATRRRLAERGDPMACHISQLLDEQNHKLPIPDKQFNGCHYDENVGGWVSNFWDTK